MRGGGVAPDFIEGCAFSMMNILDLDLKGGGRGARPEEGRRVLAGEEGACDNRVGASGGCLAQRSLR